MSAEGEGVVALTGEGGQRVVVGAGQRVVDGVGEDRVRADLDEGGIAAGGADGLVKLTGRRTLSAQ